jgi:hypothetical protein
MIRARPAALPKDFSQLICQNIDHSRSRLTDGASEVEATSDLSAAGICAALFLGGAPSRAS